MDAMPIITATPLRHASIVLAMVSLMTIATPAAHGQAPTVRESQRTLEILWQFDTGG